MPRQLALALLLSTLAACARPGPPLRAANPTVIADCRAEADRQYQAQNRVELSQQDERDNPFAAGYVSGIVTRGLSSRYALDNQVDSCIRANGGNPAATPDTRPAPAFTPARQ